MTPKAFRTAATIVATSAAASFADAGQVRAGKLPHHECVQAAAIIIGLRKEYKLSSELDASFATFIASQCDLDTDFNRRIGTVDDTAFGQFRLLLVARRTAAAQAVAAPSDPR